MQTYELSITYPAGSTIASAEYIGDGIFLTAAHLFDEYIRNTNPDRSSAPGYTEYTYDPSYYVPSTVGSAKIASVEYLRPWRPEFSIDPTAKVSQNDLAAVSVGAGSVGAAINPVILFADPDSVDSYLKPKALSFDGYYTTVVKGGSETGVQRLGNSPRT